jgi:hypothetical protein
MQYDPLCRDRDSCWELDESAADSATARCAKVCSGEGADRGEASPATALMDPAKHAAPLRQRGRRSLVVVERGNRATRPTCAQSDWPPVEAASRSGTSLSRASEDLKSRVSRRVKPRLLAGATPIWRNICHDTVDVLATSSPSDLSAHSAPDSTTHELLPNQFDSKTRGYPEGKGETLGILV